MALLTALFAFTVLLTGSDAYNVVCYLPNFRAYRTTPWNFGPDDIGRYVNARLCTHINLAFSSINAAGDGIVISEPDLDERFYKALTDLRKNNNTDLKVLTALGGYVDSGHSDLYSTMMKSSATRATFITNAKKFVQDRGLDGLDVDWEYPTCWQGNCDGHDDKINFGLFMKELSASFHESGLLVTAAVTNDPNIITAGYDVKTLSDNVDFLNVMCYDLNNYRSGKTGLNAPFGPDQPYTTKGAMSAWVNSGASPSKLVLGLPLYGKAYTLRDSAQHGIGAPASGPGQGDFVTDEDVPYFQICKNVVSNGWTKVYEQDRGAYAYKGDQWVGYDDSTSVKAKVDYVKSKGFAGIMVWDLTQDDYLGQCCGLKLPLMNAINLKLNGNGQDPDAHNCG